MSVKVMAAAWDYSRASGSALLVLLAIADSCDHDGTGAWPAVSTIGRKTRLSTRTVQRQIQQLIELGEVRVVPGPGHIRIDRRPNGYEVMLPGLKDDLSDWRPVAKTGRQDTQTDVTKDAWRGDTHVTQPVLTHPDPIEMEKDSEVRQAKMDSNVVGVAEARKRLRPES